MIGIDIVKIHRFERFISRFGTKALQRFLFDEEIELIKSTQNAAGFWAIKEATSKALQTGIGKEFSFFDVKVTKTKKGAPEITLSQKIIDRFQIIDASCSITHDGEYVIAVVALTTLKKKSLKGFVCNQ